VLCNRKHSGLSGYAIAKHFAWIILERGGAMRREIALGATLILAACTSDRPEPTAVEELLSRCTSPGGTRTSTWARI
jgi:hypothetical protein